MLFTVNKKQLKIMIKSKRKLFNDLSKKYNPNKLKQKIKQKFDYIKNNKYIQSSKILNFNINALDQTNLIEKLQDKLEYFFQSDVNQVVLRQSTFWAKSITWVLMGSTAFAVGWISIAKTDEVVIALGKLEPKGGVIVIQMPLEGVAREILITEGEKVQKGQILIKLDTEITASKNKALQIELGYNQTILEKLKYLATEGAVSELQVIEQKAKINNIQNEIKTNLVRLRYQEIVSPADGTVFDLKPNGPGYVARSTEPVLKIVPNNNLLAKIEIDSRTIGFVKTGKKADISIDSFPASDFGVLKGTLTKIGSDALPPIPAQGKGYRFPAEITLEKQYLKIKSGEKLPIQTGMSLTANIKLRKVTYIQLLLNKFTKKTESLKSI